MLEWRGFLPRSAVFSPVNKQVIMDSGLGHPSGAGSGQIDTSRAPSCFHPPLLLRSSGRDLGNGKLRPTHPSISCLFPQWREPT